MSSEVVNVSGKGGDEGHPLWDDTLKKLLNDLNKTTLDPKTKRYVCTYVIAVSILHALKNVTIKFSDNARLLLSRYTVDRLIECALVAFGESEVKHVPFVRHGSRTCQGKVAIHSPLKRYKELLSGSRNHIQTVFGSPG